MPEKTDRNQRLYNTWKSGKFKSISALARSFHLRNPEVAWRIIERYKAKEQLQNGGNT